MWPNTCPAVIEILGQINNNKIINNGNKILDKINNKNIIENGDKILGKINNENIRTDLGIKSSCKLRYNTNKYLWPRLEYLRLYSN